MSKSIDIACFCASCGTNEWYVDGRCDGCRSADDIEFTWNGAGAKANPNSSPKTILQLDAGASDQLLDNWTNLLLVRGLIPRNPKGTKKYESPPWYQRRGIRCSATINSEQSGEDFGKKTFRAGDWANRSFVIRLMVTFEEFGNFDRWVRVRCPNNAGMRELHYARRLRNEIAHGSPLTEPSLVLEETELFRPTQKPSTKCSLAIEAVLEQLWARLLIYAKSLEKGHTSLPPDPCVVVATEDTFEVQSFEGLKTGSYTGTQPQGELRIGEVISLNDLSQSPG